MGSVSTSRGPTSTSRWPSRPSSSSSTCLPSGAGANRAERTGMVKAIVVHEYGGPDMMKWEEVSLGAPSAGEARVKHGAIGVNFVDVYNRTGLYKAPKG